MAIVESLESRQLLSSVGIAAVAADSPPANDNFANAIELSGPTASANGTTVAATIETGESALSSSTASVWYSWKAPANGYVGISSSGTFPDYSIHQVHVFTGDSIATLKELTEKFSGLFGNEFRALADQTYRISVNDWSGGTGDFSLGLRLGLPRVTIKAADTTAAETRPGERPDTATFLVKRTGPTDRSLRVRYFASTFAANTAKSGKDYQPLPGSIKIPAGKSSARITVHPIDDRRIELTETIDLGLEALYDSYVTLGSRALVEILDNERHSRTAPRRTEEISPPMNTFSISLIRSNDVLGPSSDGNDLCGRDLPDRLAQGL